MKDKLKTENTSYLVSMDERRGIGQGKQGVCHGAKKEIAKQVFYNIDKLINSISANNS